MDSFRILEKINDGNVPAAVDALLRKPVDDTITILLRAHRQISPKKTHKIGTKDTGIVTAVVVNLVQAILRGDKDEDLGQIRRKAFEFTAKLVGVVCEEKVDFAAKLIGELLKFGEEPELPAVILILNLFTKQLGQFVVSDKIERKVFALKNISKMAVAIYKKEASLQNVRSDLAHIEDDETELKNLILSYIGDYAPDITGCYEALWNECHDSENYVASTKAHAELALIFLLRKLKQRNFRSLVSWIRFLLPNEAVTVKKQAFNAMAQVVKVAHVLLDDVNVVNNIIQCLEESGSKSLADACTRALLAPPKIPDDLYAALLLKLLTFPDDSVVEKTIEITADFLKTMTIFPRKNQLILTCLNISNPDLEKSRVKFFSDVFLENGQIDFLLQLPPEDAQRFLREYLRKVQDTKNFDENLSRFADKLIFALNTNARLPAAYMIHAILKEFPQKMSRYDEIVMAFRNANLDDDKFLLILCRILSTLTIPFDLGFEVLERAEMILRSKGHLKIPEGVELLGYLLNVYSSVKNLVLSHQASEFPSAQALHRVQTWVKEFVSLQFALLQDTPETGADTDKTRRALVIVILMWRKELKSDPEVWNLVMKFLKRSELKPVILAAIGVVRKWQFSEQDNSNLNETIADGIQSTDVETVSAALYLVECTLIGDTMHYAEPSLKELCSKTSELMSALVQKVLPAVLQCLSSGEKIIRHKAARTLWQIQESGQVNRLTLIQHLILMSTDPDDYVSRTGKKFLHAAIFEIYFTKSIAMKFNEGFKLAYQLAKTLTGKDFIRGFNESKLSTCHVFYVLLQETKSKKKTEDLRKIVKEVLAPIQEENFYLGIYKIDQIIFLPYQSLDDIKGVLQEMENFLSTADDKVKIVKLLKKAEKAITQCVKAKSKRVNDYLTDKLLEEIEQDSPVLAIEDSDDEVLEENVVVKKRTEVREKTKKKPLSIKTVKEDTVVKVNAETPRETRVKSRRSMKDDERRKMEKKIEGRKSPKETPRSKKVEERKSQKETPKSKEIPKSEKNTSGKASKATEITPEKNLAHEKRNPNREKSTNETPKVKEMTRSGKSSKTPSKTFKPVVTTTPKRSSRSNQGESKSQETPKKISETEKTGNTSSKEKTNRAATPRAMEMPESGKPLGETPQKAARKSETPRKHKLKKTIFEPVVTALKRHATSNDEEVNSKDLAHVYSFVGSQDSEEVLKKKSKRESSVPPLKISRTDEKNQSCKRKTPEKVKENSAVREDSSVNSPCEDSQKKTSMEAFEKKTRTTEGAYTPKSSSRVPSVATEPPKNRAIVKEIAVASEALEPKLPQPSKTVQNAAESSFLVQKPTGKSFKESLSSENESNTLKNVQQQENCGPETPQTSPDEIPPTQAKNPVQPQRLIDLLPRTMGKDEMMQNILKNFDSIISAQQAQKEIYRSEQRENLIQDNTQNSETRQLVKSHLSTPEDSSAETAHGTSGNLPVPINAIKSRVSSPEPGPSGQQKGIHSPNVTIKSRVSSSERRSDSSPHTQQTNFNSSYDYYNAETSSESSSDSVKKEYFSFDFLED